MKKDKEKKKKRTKSVADNLTQGVKYDIFLKHFPMVLMVLFFAMWYISSRYDHATAMESINNLDRKLEIARTEVQSERSIYMSRTREIAMKEMVDSLKLGLSIQEQPPFKLTLK